jgi:hypothetical protein
MSSSKSFKLRSHRPFACILLSPVPRRANLELNYFSCRAPVLTSAVFLGRLGVRSWPFRVIDLAEQPSVGSPACWVVRILANRIAELTPDGLRGPNVTAVSQR